MSQTQNKSNLRGSILKFRSKSFVNKLENYKKEYNFTEKELLLIKKRFSKISKKGILSLNDFRESLGILGLENASFLSDRIFFIIDSDRDGKANFDDFLKYMNILINGNDRQKASLSFGIIDNNKKGKINYEDIENMIKGVVDLWNALTDSKVAPSKEYIDYIFKTLSKNKKKEVDFEEFLNFYVEESEFFGWFELLNQNDINIDNMNESEKQLFYPNNNKSIMIIKEKEENLEEINKIIIDFEKQLTKCVQIIKKKKEKNSNNDISPFLTSKINLNPLINKTNYGPNFNKLSPYKHRGDNNPINIRKSENLDYEEEKDVDILSDTESLFQKSDSEKNNNSIDFDFLHEYNENIDKLLSITNKIKIEEDKTKNEKNEEIKVRSSYEIPEISNQLEDHRISQKLKQIENKYSNLKLDHLKNSTSLITTRRCTVKNIPNANKLLKEETKKNLAVFFGHENWNLVLNMMIGIRATVKKIFEIKIDEETFEKEFNSKIKHQLLKSRLKGFDFRKAYRFEDYSTLVFKKIRDIFNITTEEYLRSIGPEFLVGSIIMGNLVSLSELISSGKSGSFFYFTGDSKFMLKTISKGEFFFFRNIIRQYYNYVSKNPQTLLTRIYGLYKMKIYKTKTKVQKIYFVVMSNLFSTELQIDLRYDLKGSLYGRSSLGTNKNWDKSIALKDLDLIENKFKIDLMPEDKKMILEQIESDTKFLENNKIIDYSLLVGIHNVPISLQNQYIKQRIEKFGNKRFHESFKGGILSKDKSKIYFIGIIDTFTEYGTKKKFEHNFKKIIFGGGISCVPPHIYQKRFVDFMKEKVFE